MEKEDVVVIGGSAGSIEVLLKILPLFPKNFPLPVMVVVHRKAMSDNILEGVFQSKCALNVIEAEDKMPLMAGNIFLAPPDYHMLLEKDRTIALDSSEKVKYSRPNIDVTMFSTVRVFKNKVIGVLLTGANEDGAMGMKSIHEAGGYTIVQSPASCLIPVMPEGAMKLFAPDIVCVPDEIAKIIIVRCGKETGNE